MGDIILWLAIGIMYFLFNFIIIAAWFAGDKIDWTVFVILLFFGVPVMIVYMIAFAIGEIKRRRRDGRKG